MRKRRTFALAACLAVASFAFDAHADELAAVSAKPPVFEDAVPGGPTVAERLAEIQRRVQRAARYPAIALARSVEGETLVAFEVAPDGRPVGIETDSSSGSGALDRAALLAVEGAAPLPWVYGRVVVPIRFELADAE